MQSENPDSAVVSDPGHAIMDDSARKSESLGRELRSRPVATGLAVAALAIAGALFMLLMAVTEGLEGYLRGKISDVSPHIVLMPERITASAPRNLIDSKEEFVELAVNRPPIERKELKPWLGMIERIEHSTPLVVAVSPFVRLEGVLRSGVRSQTASVRGIDPSRESSIGSIAASMQWGGFEELRSHANGVVIGRGISRRLRVTIGDQLQIVTATGRIEPLEVVGVFETGVDELDDRRAYITLERAQTLRDMSRIAVSGMSIQLSSIARSTEARQRIEAATGYRAVALEDANLRPLAFHRRHAVALQLLAFMLLLAAAFGTANALLGAEIVSRRLRATNGHSELPRRERARRTMHRAFVIGSLGGALATLGGYLLIRFVGDDVAAIGQFPRNNPLLGYHPERFHVTTDPLLALATCGVVLVIAMAVGTIMAARLSQRSPGGSAPRVGDDEISDDESSDESWSPTEEIEPNRKSSLWRDAATELRVRRLQSALVGGSIALAVAFMLVTLSLFGGLLDTFTARILDVTPHVTMTPRDAKRSHDEILVASTDGSTGTVELVRRAGRGERPRVRNGIALVRVVERSMSGDFRALSPFLTTEVLAGFGTTETTLELHGVYPERESVISDLKSSMQSGSVDRLQSNRSGILLGDRAASALGASLGSRLRLVSMTGEKFNAQVVGIYSTGVDVVDRRGVVNLRLAQALERALPGEVSGVGIQVGDPSSAGIVAGRVERLSGRQSETWEETHAPTLANFRYLRGLFCIVAALLLVVCALALANVMMRVAADASEPTPTSQTSRTDRRRRRHLAEALLISGAGSTAGVIVGVIGIQILSLLPGLSTDSGVVSFHTSHLPVVLHLWHIVAAPGLAMLICTIAVIAPILRYGRIGAADRVAAS